MTSTEVVDFTRLASGSVIEVQTKSRQYRIQCLGGNTISICGHPEYCPVPVPARLHGSVDTQGALEFGVIGRGMRLRFLLEGSQPVTTTRVTHLRVEKANTAAQLSSTIH